MSEERIELPDNKLPDDESFELSRRSLREDYNDYRNALGVRTLTYFVVLFTLLETILNSEKLSGIFPNLSIINLTFTAFGINLFTLGKLIVFVTLVMGVLFLAFRTFFRFTITSRYINELYWSTREDFNKFPKEKKEEILQSEEKRWLGYLQFALSLKLAGRLEGYNREKIWGILPYDFFMPKFEFGHPRRGNVFCLIISFFATVALLFILW